MTRVWRLVPRSLVFVIILLALGANAASADPGTVSDATAHFPDDPGFSITALPDDRGDTLLDNVLPDDPGFPF